MAWWGFSSGCLTQMLELLGFTVQSTTKSNPRCLVPNRNVREACTSLVAKREAGSICLSGSARVGRAAA
jgi:hypothetical protein